MTTYVALGHALLMDPWTGASAFAATILSLTSEMRQKTQFPLWEFTLDSAMEREQIGIQTSLDFRWHTCSRVHRHLHR